MTKKLMIGLLVAFVAVTLIVSTVAFAQESDSTLETLYEQIYELRRQVVERRVELGNLTAEEGERMLELMEERYLESYEEGNGRFFGMPGQGWGGGYGHCWR